MVTTHFRIAFASLRANRVRTALTTLGIVIGVASISFVLALGEGARQAVSQQVQKLGGNIIIIKPGNQGFRDVSAYNPYSTAVTSTLKEQDFRSAAAIQGVRAAPLMLISGSVKNGNLTANAAPIIATNNQLSDILGLTVLSGEFINDATSRDTVVIGQQLAIELFGTDEAHGQELTVKGRKHTVVGIIKNTKQPINLAGVDLDHAVFTGLDNGKSFNQGIAQIQQIIVSASSAQAIPGVVDKLNKTILLNHGGEKDFAVLSGNDIAQGADSFFGVILSVTVLVALIAIVVGGIGIMNIMLVSVGERVREIGIRKAVGATDAQIMWQFIIEAVVMCLSGGIVGLVIAYGLAYFVSTQLFFVPAVNWQIIIGSLALALFIGIVFGIYPAVKASRKDPIEALRQYQ